MTGTHSSVNFRQQPAALFLRNASKLHPIFTPPIEIPIYQDVHICLTGYSLCFFVIYRKRPILKILEKFTNPWRALPFHGQDRVFGEKQVILGVIIGGVPCKNSIFHQRRWGALDGARRPWSLELCELNRWTCEPLDEGP